MAVGELVVSIIGDMKELSKTFSSVQKELGDVGKKFNDVGKTMSNAGKTMSTYVTAPVLGLGAISLHTASNFDDAMRRVQAVSGSTGSEFEQLSRQARDLGASTSFSASDAADAMYYLALAGWKTNDIMDATPGLLSLAAAAGMELGTSADIVSDTMSAFQMEAGRAGEAADIFAAASSNSNTDVSMLGEAMKY
ncbi:MAG: phage tail tape measure protein, partial [Candidatus Cloacimonetes bacterium]|nr:phage tail tape measure protein [Candidatus Cloacimonadota bacterium]